MGLVPGCLLRPSLSCNCLRPPLWKRWFIPALFMAAVVAPVFYLLARFDYLPSPGITQSHWIRERLMKVVVIVSMILLFVSNVEDDVVADADSYGHILHGQVAVLPPYAPPPGDEFEHRLTISSKFYVRRALPHHAPLVFHRITHPAVCSTARNGGSARPKMNSSTRRTKRFCLLPCTTQ